MPIVLPTNQDAICYTDNQTAVCNQLNGIPCGYADATEAACARAEGDPVPTACDCEDA
jgi:hypothetical protein